MMRVLPPESPRLGDVLHHLNSTDLLWTNFGLRSVFQGSTHCIKQVDVATSQSARVPISQCEALCQSREVCCIVGPRML